MPTKEMIVLYNKMTDEEKITYRREYLTRKVKEWYEKNIEKRREVRRKQSLRYRKVNREKCLCRAETTRMIKVGEIQREVCCKCGEKAEAHHEDYSNPLQVTWLCRKHHRELHKKLKQS